MKPIAATITNVQRFSLHDGGGIRTVVFLKGCPFRCPWCCNPENLSSEPEVSFKERLCIRCSPRPDGGPCQTRPEDCPTGAKELLGRSRTVDDLLAEVVRDRSFYEESDGGVTVSGGECLLRQDFLCAFLEACHEEGISTAVETTLAVPLADAGRLPGFTDDAACVGSNVSRIRELGVTRVDVLPFHQLGQGKYDSLGRAYGLRDVPQLSERDVADVVARCRAAGLRTVVHGE